MKIKLTILITLFVLSILSAGAQSAQQYIDAGTNELGPVADDLVGANANFAAAVALQPTNETANVLWAATRLLTLPQTTAGSNFLTSLGFSASGRDFYNFTSAPPKDVNGHLIFPAGLNSSTVASFILATGIPTLQACDTNLSVVTDPTFTLFLPAAETTGIQDVTLDYGDIQMLRAMAAFGQFFGYTVNAQNADVVIPQVESAFNNNTFTLQWVLQTYPSLAALTTPADLPLSKAALTNAIAHYFAASDFIRNVRAPGFIGLFNLSTNDTSEEAEFRTGLTNFLASLNGPTLIDASRQIYINSSNYFSGAVSPRKLVPQFTGDSYNINTVPDYTFGGILPNTPAYVTETLLREEFPVYTGIYIGDGSGANIQYYNTGDGYAVSDSNGNYNGSFAVYLGANGQATLLGHDDGDGTDDGSDFGLYAQFTVDGHGNWGFTNGAVSGFGKIDRNGDFNGEIDYTNVSVFLNAAVQSPYGSFQNLSGFYSGSFTGSHAGNIYAIIAADGEIFFVPIQSGGSVGGGGSQQIQPNNQFSYQQVTGTLVQGTLSAGSPPFVSGTYTNSDSTGGTFRVTRSTQIAFDAPPAITKAPVNQNVEAGSNAVFTVTGTGSAPLTYQWSVNGTNIYNATNSTLTISNCTLDLNSNTYAVTLNNVAGSTNAAAELFVGDFIPPTLSITNLVSGQEVSNMSFTAMGLAWDNASVTNVSYDLNSNGWQTASMTFGATTNWSALLQLTPGSNTLSVYAQDENGNVSTTHTVEFFYVQSAQLTVLTNHIGWGTVSPSYNGTFLQIGKSYSMTATAAPGFAFLNWVDPAIVVTNGPIVMFQMQTGLVLEADFIDVTKPTVIITNLTAGLQVSNASYTVMGRSWDNVAVSQVFYSFDNGSWMPVTPLGSATNWSTAPLALNPGPNTISVYSEDSSGNVSATNTVAFNYVVSAQLTVQTNNVGWGTVSPNDNGAFLQLGNNYSITATPAAGFAFTNWSGGTNESLTVLTSKATLTFAMQTNQIVQANFIDITKPGVIVTNLTSGMLVSNANNFMVAGRSWDNVAVASVFYNFDSSGWTNVMPSGSATNWSTAALTLNPGTNTISVYAQDTSGNLSPTNSLSFQYVVTTPLMVVTNGFGWGTLSPNDNGQNLQIGRNYSITATAGTGFAFTNWSGGTNGTLTLVTNGMTVIFMMESNLDLSANFWDVTKPGVIITNLAAGMLVSNANFTVMGRSWDNVTVSNVFYNLDGNGWLTATQGIVSSNWSAALPLNPGTNTLAVYAEGTGGNVSPTNSVSFQYVSTTPLTVATNNFGWGTLSPNDNGQNLQVGRNYSITATAVAGFAFTNWSGGTNGTLTVLTNKAALTFLMESNQVVQANFIDITKPGVIITNITAGMLVSNADFTVMGRSWDNVTVSNVYYNLDGNGWLTATQGIVSSNWSAALPLNPGTNTVAVYAEGTGGNVSPTNSVSFQYVSTTPLMVVTNSFGWGTLSPNDNGQNLQVGRNYSITATAAAGFAFTNWSGGTNGTLTVLTNGLAVTFMMESNLDLSANFRDVTKPTLIITNLAAGQSISNGTGNFTVMGRSWDNVAVTNISYNINSNGWLNVMPSGSATNWTTVQLGLTPGANTISVYAQDSSGNLSVTDTVKFTYVKLFTLADYNPLALGTQWIYTGTNNSSVPVDLQLSVVSTNFNLTLYTGGNPAHAYNTNSVQIAQVFQDPSTLITNETGYMYDYAGPLVGAYGDDIFNADGVQEDAFRVDRGIIFPAQMTVGGSFTGSESAYESGTNIGTFGVTLQVLSNTNLAVPAGAFNDVLHVRETVTLTGKTTRVDDYWWARSVGLIQRQGISGPDAPIYYVLTNSSLLPLPPAVVVASPEVQSSVKPAIAVQNPNSGGGQIVFNLTGQTGQVVVVEGSSDLIHWQPLQTNTLKGGSVFFSDAQSTNYPARFYRIRTPR